jgi:hypothetical protein
VETPTRSEHERQEAIEIVTQIGSLFGYGDMIFQLKNAWAAMLMKTEGFDQELADKGVGHICPWCNTDGRTGQKIEQQVENTTKTKSSGAIAATKRPPDYEDLSAEDQWAADKRLGILDWDGN